MCPLIICELIVRLVKQVKHINGVKQVNFSVLFLFLSLLGFELNLGFGHTLNKAKVSNYNKAKSSAVSEIFAEIIVRLV